MKIIKAWDNLVNILKNEDLQKYKDEGFENLIEVIYGGDIPSGIAALKSAKDYLFHIPTALFWDKMKRFLYGTYHDFEDQVKMASRFNNDYSKYREFTKKQMNVISQIEDEKKIDFFANLTRCVMLELISLSQYNRMTKSLLDCTSDELEFIHNNIGHKVKYNIDVYFLKMAGLVEQDINNDPEYYIFTEYAKTLNTYALSDDETSKPSIKDIETGAPADTKFATTSDIDEVLRWNNH